jgi:hypothetical protein
MERNKGITDFICSLTIKEKILFWSAQINASVLTLLMIGILFGNPSYTCKIIYCINFIITALSLGSFAYFYNKRNPYNTISISQFTFSGIFAVLLFICVIITL